MAEKLKIISLGGLNEIGKNLTVYEYGGDIIVVDCGMGFPDDDMYGIDVVIPDVSYLIKNQSKIRGIFITHGHEDHIGALPYVLRSINAPIYATRMSMGLIRLKLEEHRLLSKTKLITCEAGDVVKAGKFSVEFIHVNHSIADAVAFAIKCPVGTCVHTGDFKIDSTPIQGGMMDLARLGELGKEGVLALLADSTNVERSGFTRSERSVGASFDALFRGCQERIIVTTFASNVDRIQQIIDVAARYGRKVAVTGRSMENIMKVSTELGYMNVPDGVLMDLNHIKSLPKHKVCIITTGSQGETMSALTRMAFNTHRQVDLMPGDRVIISASAIPGNENAIGNVVNELYRKGAEVMNERELALHVSGHACQEELKIVHALVKPKFFIPVHGEQRMLQIHARLAQGMGMDPNHVLVSDIGRVMELTPNSARLAGTVTAGQVFVDGYGVGDVGSVVLRDRRHLAQDGMIVVVLSMSGEDGALVSGPDIITRGFVYVKESEGLMEELRQVAMEAIQSVDTRYATDWSAIKSTIKGDLSNYLYKKTKRSPMILPVIMEV
ncbi:ribonuclease J [Colidextribacter sp. 210702-DFI.3.9]|uniref:Ribonuclease J n=1 Tax=Flintibacter faecis TaxID=2763047 RepID=A0A8J6J627_9FIRM|nr:ribonuclease J [Flintibacter faecis]MBC5717821.1 ribonuclease J [Flintibacter faecis]MCB6500972.1 ribonuclease J [Colidextribacter sp. 210702-DFI.3.9]MCG4470506.1 ribonuclease J [Lawsonibacter sp. DFI.6.74]MCG4774774.1 ribonuclease J [Lawsonibacter sp. DFI.5.51]